MKLPNWIEQFRQVDEFMTTAPTSLIALISFVVGLGMIAAIITVLRLAMIAVLVTILTLPTAAEPDKEPYSCQLFRIAERKCAYNTFTRCDTQHEVDRLRKECLRDGGRP